MQANAEAAGDEAIDELDQHLANVMDDSVTDSTEDTPVQGAAFSDGVILSWAELQLAENGTKYGYDASCITDTSIGQNAFNRCTDMISINIPEGIKYINASAFYGCTNLTSIAVPDSITQILMSAFAQCTSLSAINVNVDNQYYCSIDGILYDKNVSTLGHYPAQKAETTFIIPDSVTKIDDYAFAYCDNLTSIEIPDGVTYIGNSAFRACSKLASIAIPDGVTSIGVDMCESCTSLNSVNIPASVTQIYGWAFEDCTSLSKINFAGTIAQWNAITFGSGWRGNVPATEVVCSDGVVSLY